MLLFNHVTHVHTVPLRTYLIFDHFRIKVLQKGVEEETRDCVLYQRVTKMLIMQCPVMLNQIFMAGMMMMMMTMKKRIKRRYHTDLVLAILVHNVV